jgi:hypothetical protein
LIPDQQSQLAQLEAEVARQQAALAAVEAEVTELERDLSEFRQRYERLLAPVASRLRAVKEAIEELEHRRYMEKLMGDAQPASSPPPPTNYIPVEEQYRRAWEKNPFDDIPPPITPRQPPGDSTLKNLYRQLARRFHPDLASDEADRERRTRLMAMINEAYEHGDADLLRYLSDQPFSATSADSLDTLRLRQLQTLISELAGRIEQAEQARAALIHNDLMRLKVEEKLAKRQGRNLLREMSEQMEQEYWERVAHLEVLRRMP